MNRLLIVVDMQNGVFDSLPRFDRAGVVERINRLARLAQGVIFIRHEEADMPPGSDAWQLLPELYQPPGCHYVGKTACDAFYRTELNDLLQRLQAGRLTLCGCATDYCLDSTIKGALSRDYAVAVAGDAHTTADRPPLKAADLITHYNQVWANLIVPGNEISVRATQEILDDWR